MKVLHIIPSLRKGGAERLVIDIAEGLISEPDITVKIVVFRNMIEYDVEKVRDIIHFIPSSIDLSFIGKNQLDIEGLQKFIDEFDPDIIHSHLFEAEIVSRSCFFPKAKWISHAHSNMGQFKNFSLKTILNKGRFTHYFEKRYLIKRYRKNNGNHFIAISQDTKNFYTLVQNKFPVYLIPNAINTQKFRHPERTARLDSPIKLITTGSLFRNKNHELFLDIISQLEKFSMNVNGHILGHGPELQFLKKRAEKLHISEQCFFHGAVDDVEKQLQAAHIYVHTAYSEAMGISILEAMASGLPVVSLDGGGNRDIVINNQTGFLIKENKESFFIDKILLLIRDQELYQKISNNAAKLANKYDLSYHKKRLLTLYEELIS